jgi:hypothetical protein
MKENDLDFRVHYNSALACWRLSMANHCHLVAFLEAMHFAPKPLDLNDC